MKKTVIGLEDSENRNAHSFSWLFSPPGDSVYILRDRPQQKSGERRQPAYRLAKDVKPHDLLIFKIENLWIDEKYVFFNDLILFI